MTEQAHVQLLLDTCLIAGKIMTESGSEVYRVEDTMNRIAHSAGQSDSTSYVTATGLFMGFRHHPYTQFETIAERSINLEKVMLVNQLSRQFSQQELTLRELNQELVRIDHETPTFATPLQILAAGIVSCTLMYIFGGDWTDFLATFLIGMLGFAVYQLGKKWLQVKYVDQFLSAFVIGGLSLAAVSLGLAQNLDPIIIGAVMPLVPGVAITNAFRDILAGHLLSGVARATEAAFIAAAIGVGIAVVLRLFA